MSLEAARNFTARLIEDPRLGNDFAATVVGKTPEDKAIAAAQMATRLGYACTPEEAREVRDAVVGMVPVTATGEGELTEEQLQGVAGGISLSSGIANWLKGKGSLTGGVMSITGVALGGPAIGPAGLAVAAVGGAMNTIDSNPQAAQMGVTSQSIIDKAGSEIGGFFKDAFSGW